MATLDEAIEKGRRKRRIVAIGISAGTLTLLIVYFGWLFLMKGYSFSVKPETAENHQFMVKSGAGFFLQNKLYVLTSTNTVVVSADKYQAQEVQVNESSPAIIQVELKPKPARVEITLTPAVNDVTWLVNGNKHQSSSTFTDELEPGHYQVIAQHPAFEAALVEFTAAMDADVDIEMQLIPVQGTINLQSQPAGAQVTLNNEVIGTTPLTTAQVGGEYTVVVNHPGYEPITDTLAVTATNRSPQRQYRLQPVQATLNLALSPANGLLLVNGKPAQSPVSVDANQQHVIRYEKPGFQAQSKTIQLKPAESERVTFALEPELATVKFTANEPSELYLNGKKLGNTPLQSRLQTLPMKVEFRKAGYRSVVQSFQPTTERLSHVQAEMLREFDARRKEGKPLFVSTLGIEMSRLTPKPFTMGSPANEPNRNRNEHQVKVAFSRDVWISRHEITEAQFAAFSGASSKTQLPKTNVSWTQAALYTNWLSKQEGLQPFYVVRNNQVVGIDKSSRGYRLPTEAEWEYVAKLNRRASPTIYAWGSQDRIRDNQGNFADESLKGQQTFILRDYNDGFAGKAPVGSFKADRGGFYDIDGNVKEWVHDFYSIVAPNLNQVHTDYMGPLRGNDHVVKGASYKTGRLKNLRVSVRNGASEGADDIGFRIARYQ